jgi:predicted nucleic acid-binding protein
MTAFDTNVLIYACDKANPDRQKRAIELFTATVDGVLLWQVACEFIAASRKLAPQGFTPQDAWSRLAEFIAVFPLIVPSEPVIAKAQLLHLRDGWSFWDAMITAACEVANVKRLYTEDMPGRSISGTLEIVNPFVRA